MLEMQMPFSKLPLSKYPYIHGQESGVYSLNYVASQVKQKEAEFAHVLQVISQGKQAKFSPSSKFPSKQMH